MSLLKRKFCESCPRKLKSFPDAPCPLALEAIHAIQADKEWAIDNEIGCSWYINSEKHGYCFWNYARTLDEPVSDREICSLLCISQSTLNATYESAIKKLQAIKDTDDMRELAESIIEYAELKHDDKTIYFPEEFKSKIDKEEELAREEEPKEKPKKIKKGYGNQPIHRDGNKVDLYGISSKKTRERMAKEKKNGK